MLQDPRLALVERFFRGTGTTYDRVVNVATFGIDRLWKRRIARSIPPSSRRILDLACGTGLSTMAIARRFPGARIVGVELREEYLALAREKARAPGMSNVELVLSRAEDYQAAEPFDCIASSYLAKYADLPRLVRNCRGMLNPGGVLLMHDFILPPRPSLVALWRLYFRALQLVGGALLPSWNEIYYGLPKLIEETRWLAELQQALAQNGFRDVRTDYLTAYGSALVSARK
ncbi:MAG: methyltransferase domain-containing protein [Betaproteobacteria bacterium]|nr:MAG: methyltransferase domain-containing protein [Betaproteobacteria bacterium]